MATETKCDHCGSQLDDAGPMPSFRIALAVESMPTSSNIRYSLHVTPPLPRGRHDFCGTLCLRQWLDEESPPPPEREVME